MKPLPAWAAKEAPGDGDLLPAPELEGRLNDWLRPSFTAAGDLMLGGRSSRIIREEGPDYPFRSVRPLLERSPIVLANLEGPFARHAIPGPRRYSYRIDPQLAPALARAGITLLNLANNHLLDCGREGVLETLQVVREAKVMTVGAGADRDGAHRPAIQQAGPLRIGFLGYYWNRRCAATAEMPGAAMDSDEDLALDIHRLKTSVDRVVVTFHWGVPYQRPPSEAARHKAHHAIDCGADVIVGHHPHVVQPYEIYRRRPIFYSLGNFTFGSGNSGAEGLLLSVRFEPREISCVAIPIYVKNRDPRVHFQPKVLIGRGGSSVLAHLSDSSSSGGDALQIRDGWGFLRVTPPASAIASERSRSLQGGFAHDRPGH